MDSSMDSVIGTVTGLSLCVMRMLHVVSMHAQREYSYFVLHCIALYSDIYIALLTAKSLTEALLIAITSSINSTVSYRPIIM